MGVDQLWTVWALEVEEVLGLTSFPLSLVGVSALTLDRLEAKVIVVNTFLEFLFFEFFSLGRFGLLG